MGRGRGVRGGALVRATFGSRDREDETMNLDEERTARDRQVAILEERINDLNAQNAGLRRELLVEREAGLAVRIELQNMTRNLTSVQARCTELREELQARNVDRVMTIVQTFKESDPDIVARAFADGLEQVRKRMKR
jgi:hypothetical protein